MLQNVEQNEGLFCEYFRIAPEEYQDVTIKICKQGVSILCVTAQNWSRGPRPPVNLNFQC